jgi:hypothetical protein
MIQKVSTFMCLFFMVMGFHAVSAANDFDWNKIEPSANVIPGRMGHKLVYDTLRQVVVLFGGEHANDSERNDTWEWDGMNWTQIFPSTRPRTRDFFGMTYDSNRNVIVVFGGEDWPASLNDTWEYDGTNWKQINTPTRPLSRAHVNIAFDKKRNKVVMFGGWHWYSTLADTWEYDGSNWTRIYPATSPPRTQNNLLVYDEKREVVVLFGGSIHNAGVIYNDTWEWDGVNWTYVNTPNRPSPREEPCGTYDSDRGKVILFGGSSAEDTWEYDGNDWTQIITDHTPGKRAFSSMAYQAHSKTIILHGGHHGGFSNDNWELPLVKPCTYGPADQPVSFTRKKGKPVLETLEWESCGGQGSLKITSKSVSSAYIYLNGVLVTGPDHFNRNVETLEFAVDLVEGNNILQVELRGKPGGNIRISFEQN